VIEIRKHPQLESGYQLFTDGRLIKDASVLAFPNISQESMSFIVRVNDFDGSEKIASHHFSEIPSSVKEMILTDWFDWADLPVSITIQRNALNQFYKFEVTFISYVSWRGAYRLSEYFKELREVVLEAENPEIGVKRDFPFDISILNIPPDKNIASEIARCSNILSHFNKEAKKRLTERLPSESVAMMFDFPNEVRVPCEQYLLYFAQFLKDLGVEADTALTHEAGQVLFTVTPNDKAHALDKIRQALEIYLKLPVSKLTDEDRDIVTQRLAANIYHLKSQLALSQAMLQTKDATIEAKQLTIDIQKSLLSGEIIFDSLKDVTPKPEDKENLLGGVVALATYKDKGIEVNLAELYRKLKQLFKDNK
jgi:hypothetical protein